VYIIVEVHMLSRHAFNSMLKTLEEPPEHVKFILATTDPQRLPVTILSRCLQFNLKPLTPPLIAGHLKHVLTAEKIPFEEAALVQIGKAAGGSLRDSLSLLDQAIAHGGGKVNAIEVAAMLGSLGGDLVWPLLERIVEGDGKGTIDEAQRIASRSVSMDTVLEDLAGLLHRVALAQAGAAGGEDDADAARVSAMASRIDAGRVQVMYQVAVLGRRDLPLAPDEYAGFTMTLLRMLSFGAATPGARAEVKTVSSPKPVAATAKPAAPSTTSFDGNWPALVERMNLTGMARMAAQHAEFASFENNHLELVVPEAQRMYAEKPYLEKLKAELAPHLGANLRLSMRVGTTAGTSLAAARSKEMAQKQASAAEAIEDDPFVRDLVRDLGAEVVPSSIRPLDEPGGKPTNGKR
jgi:DNA polymerase-3 subunit gamma/tau